ncbi:MAG: patatin-like phospholipase family protein [Xanthobacteraceae bacterium]|nr:patatin-like phospholipase family protein [Xanthobacteraceae bacterium]
MENHEFEIGLVMAGAISAGAYSAGVIDFFVEALDKYYEARKRSDWTGPTHDVRIPIVAGASAGGMTAAITALHAFHDLVPAQPQSAPPPKAANRLYSSWVTDISIERLLEISDLTNPKAHVPSGLCSDVLGQIVDSAFAMQGAVRERPWVGRGTDHSLRVRFTLTNVRGIPYSFKVFGADSPERFGMTDHGDYLDFSVGMPGSAAGGALALDIRDTSQPAWDLFKTGALATGAFPIGLAARRIKRPTQDYDFSQLVGMEDRAGVFQTKAPDVSVSAANPYQFTAIDGGTIDNEPLELARRYLADGVGHGDHGGEQAKRAIILIAPFPNYARLPPDDHQDALIHIAPKLLSMLIDQARFKPDELAKAEDDTNFSRYMIAPTRPANNAAAREFPIASGTIDGFGGFLHESFRRHDYLLGRRNAQAFIRWNLALPEDNQLFAAYRASPQWGRRDEWYVRNVEGAQGSILADRDYLPKQYALKVDGPPAAKGLPIIPLTEDLKKPIEIAGRDLPNPDGIDLAALRTAIDRRVGPLTERLIDLDLRRFTDGMLFGSAIRWAAQRYASQLLSKKALELAQGARQSVREAFRT